MSASPLRRRLAAFLAAVIALAAPGAVRGDEAGLFRHARSLYDEGDYYNAITELMRYRVLYPGGARYRKSILLLGRAYYRGGNTARAGEVMEACADDFNGTDDGEDALFFLTGLRILEGSPMAALAAIRLYRSVYPEGASRIRVELHACYAAALAGDLERALSDISRFRERYGDAQPGSGALELEGMVREELNRPRKSMFLAVAGSILVPGFGYMYTGRYLQGTLSFLSNSLLIFLIYNAVRTGNTVQIVLFSLMEVSFYQYSLYGAMRSVREYNSSGEFYRGVVLSFGASF